MNALGQSEWRDHPECVNIRKQLRNGFFTEYYNHEIEVDKNLIYVVDNRTLVLNLKCPSRAIQFRNEIIAETRCHLYDLMSHRSIESRWFLPGEPIQVACDLTALYENYDYYLTFKFHTDREEIYFISISLIKDPLDSKKIIGITPPSIVFTPFQKKQESEDFVYTWIENRAEFPGSDEGLVRFLKENIRYENLSLRKDVHISKRNYVSIGMIIDKDGSILYPEVLDSSNPSLNEEAIRLVGLMPKWKPGSIDGVKVKLRLMVNIDFCDLENSCIMLNDFYI